MARRPIPFASSISSGKERISLESSLLRIPDVVNSTLSFEQPKLAAATSARTSLACRAALITALPVTKVCRLADVAPPSGVVIVSAKVTLILS